MNAETSPSQLSMFEDMSYRKGEHCVFKHSMCSAGGEANGGEPQCELCGRHQSTPV
jgi:hypothetical protein